MNEKLFKFKPIKLIDSRSVVEKKHPIEKGKIGTYLNSANENDIKTLILKIEKISDNRKLERIAFELSSKQLYLLANYCARNKFNVDLTNILRIIDLRYRKVFTKIFYNAFQQNYNNKVFNKFLKYILETKEADKHLGIRSGLSKEIAMWLAHDNIIKSVLSSYFKLNNDFEIFIKLFKMNDMSKLVIDCKKQIYLYCDEKHYLKTKEEYLCNTIKSFTREELAQFANNYLLKVKYEKFQTKIMNFIYLNFDKPTNVNYSMYWKKISQNAISKYNKWMKEKILKDFFGESERFDFWKQYIDILEEWHLVKRRGQLFLDFGNFVVIEFKHIGNAAYIYSKNVFNKYFYKYVNDTNSVSNNMLKNRDLSEEYIEHRGNWQYKAALAIRSAFEND